MNCSTMKFCLKFTAVFVLSSVVVDSADAVKLLVNEEGSLIGANGVIVEGVEYNVRFSDGSCQELFNGCDDPNDFVLDATTAFSASDALLNQVFLDGPLGNFDSEPGLTNGCEPNFRCIFLVPFSEEDGRAGQNNETLSRDVTSNALIGFIEVDGVDGMLYSSSLAESSSTLTIAAFRLIPEPGTVSLCLIGFAAVLFRSRRDH